MQRKLSCAVVDHCTNRPRVSSLFASVKVGLLLLIVTTLSSGCISFSGKSSGSWKRDLQKSYLYKSANRYYPNGVPEDPGAFPTLGAKQISEIQNEVAQLNKALNDVHGKYFTEISNSFPGGVRKTFKSQIEIRNSGKATARSEENGRILIDAKVAQALFRGAVVDSYEKPGFWGSFDREHDSAASKSTNAATILEKKALGKLLKDVESIRNLRGRTLIGDLFGGLDSPWFEATEIGVRSQEIQFGYIGTVFFLLAHERGHLALAHHQKLAQQLNGLSFQELGPEQQTNYCRMRQEFEREADLYASILLATFESKSGAVIMPGFFGIEKLAGFEAFFHYSYSYSGFSDFASGDDCAYPSVEERFQACKQMNETIVESHREKVWGKIEKELSNPKNWKQKRNYDDF